MSTLFNTGNGVKDFDAVTSRVSAPELNMGTLSDMQEPAPLDHPLDDPNTGLDPMSGEVPLMPSFAPVTAEPSEAPQPEASVASPGFTQMVENLEAGVALGMALSAAKKEAAESAPTTAPKFTVVSAGKESWANFSRDYKPAEMEQVPCVAETTMLMQYMVAMERHRATTLSFPACGVDPKVFYEHKEKYNPDGPMVLEVDTGSADGATTAEYEMVEVDGVNYLSCTTDCLDPDYMHSIIAEATEAIYTHNKYVFTLVGPKPVESNMRGEGEPKVFVETLRLNSYELSALIGYMESITGVSVQHCEYNGRAALTFTRG